MMRIEFSARLFSLLFPESPAASFNEEADRPPGAD